MEKPMKNEKMQPLCEDTRPCFAKNGDYCAILRKTYEDGMCPWCKRNKENVVVNRKERRYKRGTR